MPRTLFSQKFLVSVLLAALTVCTARAQDSSDDKGIDSFLLRQHGLTGRLARSIYRDTGVGDATPVRNDLLFRRYQGRTIRLIEVYAVDFGTPISDTSQRHRSRLTRLADMVHRKSRGFAIKNNLFFKEGDKILPALLADNERHLRDQPYLRDARIIVRPVAGRSDLVDVIVLTKDVLSIGGSFELHDSQTGELVVKEDNFAGWGDRVQLASLYDSKRRFPFGYGMEFIKRNIGGSFINGTVGYKTYGNTRNTSRREETSMYASLVRPLVNPYVRFTYSLEGAQHYTNNMYVSDSLYNQDIKYKYFNYDAWLGWNTGAFGFRGIARDDRLRMLVSLRYLKQQFDEVPDKYTNTYNYMYMTVRGVLLSASVFKQNTFKTQYVYGFGRNEDVPEGLDVTLTAGRTVTENRSRLYTALELQRYYFTERESYFSYTVRAGGYFKYHSMEDINILANLDYFNRLLAMGRWRERSFITIGIARQLNRKLNEPLFLDSRFGLSEWRNDRMITGSTRITAKGESVFFSPLNIAGFRFAPFVFGNFCYLASTKDAPIDRHFYSTLGGGIRTRNESLIFGTVELKGFYYPRGNFFGHMWNFEISTNIRFTYNSLLVKRPGFIQVN